MIYINLHSQVVHSHYNCMQFCCDKIINNKLKENLEILSSIRDHRKKSRETREIAHTSRYSY